jgi:hypothetical protein
MSEILRLRTLAVQTHQSQRHKPPCTCSCEALRAALYAKPVHHVPGRLRFKSPSFRGNTAAAATARHQLAGIDGVKSVAVNPSTGSLIVAYDPKALPPGRILEVLRHRCCTSPTPSDPVNDECRTDDRWLERVVTAVGLRLADALAERLAASLIAALV